MPFVLFVLQEQRKAFVRSFGRHVFVNAGILVEEKGRKRGKGGGKGNAEWKGKNSTC